MLRIAICDADENSCYFVRDTVSEILGSFGVESKVEIFFCPQKLFEALHDKLFEYIICDICVDNTDMIGFVERLRNERYPANVVFLSKDLSAFEKASLVFPLAYIKKPATSEIFQRMFDHVSCFRTGNRKFYVSAKNGEKYLVDENDIIYIEVFHNDICIHTDKEKIICRFTLTGFLEKLSASAFVRCHHSYAVNLSMVAEIKRYSVKMTDGSSVPVSKKNYLYVRDRIYCSGR